MNKQAASVSFVSHSSCISTAETFSADKEPLKYQHFKRFQLLFFVYVSHVSRSCLSQTELLSRQHYPTVCCAGVEVAGFNSMILHLKDWFSQQNGTINIQYVQMKKQ